MPRISSSTVTGFLGSMNMREPSARHAHSDTVTAWSRRIRFCLSAVNVR